MSKSILGLLAFAMILTATTSPLALERVARRIDSDMAAGGWNAGSTALISYYNTCTGWVWV